MTDKEERRALEAGGQRSKGPEVRGVQESTVAREQVGEETRGRVRWGCEWRAERLAEWSARLVSLKESGGKKKRGGGEGAL